MMFGMKQGLQQKGALAQQMLNMFAAAVLHEKRSLAGSVIMDNMVQLQCAKEKMGSGTRHGPAKPTSRRRRGAKM